MRPTSRCAVSSSFFTLLASLDSAAGSVWPCSRPLQVGVQFFFSLFFQRNCSDISSVYSYVRECTNEGSIHFSGCMPDLSYFLCRVLGCLPFIAERRYLVMVLCRCMSFKRLFHLAPHETHRGCISWGMSDPCYGRFSLDYSIAPNVTTTGDSLTVATLKLTKYRWV